jgi:hypothetical protein
LWRSSLSLLHELIPNVDSVAFLVNPNNAVAQLDASDVQAAAAGALGQKLIIVNAGTEVEIVAAFMTIAEQRIGGRKLGRSTDLFLINALADIGVRSRHVAKRRIHPLACISLHMTVSEPQALEADRPR